MFACFIITVNTLPFPVELVGPDQLKILSMGNAGKAPWGKRHEQADKHREDRLHHCQEIHIIISVSIQNSSLSRIASRYGIWYNKVQRT